MSAKQTLLIPLSIAALSMLSSCSLTVPLIVFSGNSEILRGSATGYLDGRGSIEFQSTQNDTKCTGAFEYKRRGYKGWGTGSASCTDGTSADFSFDAATNSKGYGAGEDSKGRPFLFAYGYSESEAKEIYDRLAGDKLQKYGNEVLPAGITLKRNIAKSRENDLKVLVADVIPQTVKITAGRYQGSGFVIRDGQRKGDSMLVMTNNHVVGSNETAGITFSNGNTYTGKVIGRSGQLDTALIAIEAPPMGISAFAFCYGSRPQIGESIVAIGTPLGVGTTVTRGIISGIAGSGMNTLIITDAAINKGNSGGPVLNYSGEVLGIATAKMGGIGVESIAFAIPMTEALDSLGIGPKDQAGATKLSECGNPLGKAKPKSDK
ncbi:trypsin-like peptidase domain-containing protein [Cyanobium sp. HWJ4-Hawea]|nr:trypsin-like peptidase domain-containing protein [Cyanobium sp. HWJ4-Hawea]